MARRQRYVIGYEGEGVAGGIRDLLTWISHELSPPACGVSIYASY